MKAFRGEAVVEAAQIEGDGSGGRPTAKVERVVTLGPRSKDAGGVACPRVLVEGVLRLRMDGESSPSGLVGIRDGELEVDGVVGKGQRSFERELLDTVEADVVRSDDGELDERGAREEDGALDTTLREPWLVGNGKSCGEDECLRVGERDRGAEERVLDVDEPRGGKVGVSRLRVVEPESLTLKGIGREVDAFGSERPEEGVPVELMTSGVKLGEG